MSRSANSIRNAGVSTFFLVVRLLLAFWSRKVFIDYLGSDLVGLSSTLTNILGLLNLADLGLTTVIASALYKPLFAKDKDTIRDIVSIFGYLFRIIGTFILTAGIVLSFFLPVIFEGKGIPISDVYVAYYAFLGSSLLGYFFNYRMNILEADQKNYIITGIVNTSNLVKIIMQIALLKLLGGSYKEWVALELVFAIVIAICINAALRKQYPWLRTDWRYGRSIRGKYKHLFRTIRQIIPHKIGSYVLNQTDSLLIFAFVSLSMVTVYTNYSMVVYNTALIMTTVSAGLNAGVGNLIAEGDKSRIKKVFHEFQALYFGIAGILVVCLNYLMEPFINLWLGEGFLLDRSILYLILFNTYVGITRTPVSTFLNGYLLYRDTWAPWTEAGLNLALSLFFGYLYGIWGIMLGTAISLLCIIVIWKPYFLYRNGFGESVWEYWKSAGIMLILLAASWCATAGVNSLLNVGESRGFLDWTKNAIIIFLTATVVYSGLLYMFCPGARNLVARIKRMLIKR